MLIRLILLIPLAVVLLFIAIATGVVVFIGWFGALVIGRTPVFVRRMTTAYLRLTVRLFAYQWLLTDRFPALGLSAVEGEPTQIAVPEATRMNRVTVFFRVILVFPVSILSALVIIGLQVFVFLMWIVVLITGHLPRPVHDAYRTAFRYQTRVTAYLLLLVPTYPEGLWGDKDGHPETTAPTTPASSPWTLSLGKGARRILVLAIVLGSLAYGAQITLDIRADVLRLQHHNQIVRATNTLGSQFNSYFTAATACNKLANPYRCLEAADLGLSRQVATYAATVGGVTDAGIDQSTIDNVVSHAQATVSALRTVGTAPPTKDGFDDADNRANLQTTVNNLTNAIGALTTQLNKDNFSSNN